MTRGLSWGRRYLMCSPDHFQVEYAINPWMAGTVDPDLAMQQWQDLRATIETAGGQVDTIAPQAGLPDMVFTANAGVVDGTTFIAGRMRHAERVEEIAHVSAWAQAAGFAVEPLSDGSLLEGLGDAMPLGQAMVVGHGARSNLGAHADLGRLTGRRIVPVHLANDLWYHVDLTLCPLDDERAMVFPEAYDADGARQVLDLIAQPLVLTLDEASTFAANSIVVGSTVIMPACPLRVGRQLEEWGFDVVVVDVGEFAKAGGAVRCLTLPLDTDLSVRPRTTEPAMEVA